MCVTYERRLLEFEGLLRLCFCSSFGFCSFLRCAAPIGRPVAREHCVSTWTEFVVSVHLDMLDFRTTAVLEYL